MISFKGVDLDTIDIYAAHVEFIDMGDGTHERVEMPIFSWVMLDHITTERMRPLSKIVGEIKSWPESGYSFELLLKDYLKAYAIGMVDSGEVPVPPTAPTAEAADDKVHSD